MSILESEGNTSVESNATPGSTINLLREGKAVRAEFLTYAQSKTHETESGWIPVAAETRDAETTLIIKSSTSASTESIYPPYQAIDFEASTGRLKGIHLHNGGYRTRSEIEKSFTPGSTDPYQTLGYFGPDRAGEFFQDLTG